MKIELKNIKYFAAGSEETSCFVAAVYIDGVKLGEVRNDGRGGSHAYHPWEICEKLNQQAAILPPVVSSIKEKDGAFFTYQPDADSIVDDLLDEYLVSGDLKRLMKFKAVYTVKGKDGIFATNKLTVTQMAAITASGVKVLPEKWNVAQLLNSLPFEDALAIYRRNRS